MGKIRFPGLLVALLLALPAIVQAQYYTWTTNTDNTITITGYSGPGGMVNVPATINGLPVSGIGTHAFAGNFNLGIVTIPNGLTSTIDEFPRSLLPPSFTVMQRSISKYVVIQLTKGF